LNVTGPVAGLACRLVWVRLNPGLH